LEWQNRAGLAEQDCQDRTARNGLLGKDCKDRAARTEMLGQDYPDVATRKGLGQDMQCSMDIDIARTYSMETTSNCNYAIYGSK
jgi:hypothetical protein